MGTATLNGLEFGHRTAEVDEVMSEGVTPSILAAIGRTPLIPLQRLAIGVSRADPVEARVAQSGRQHQGSGGRRDGRGGRAAGMAPARRDDHRGHGGQHGGRPGAGGRGEGISVHLRAARQDERREDPAACGPMGPRSWSRRLPSRPTRPRATTASPIAWRGRSPAPGGRISSPTWPTPRSTTGDRTGDLGADGGKHHGLRRGRGDRRHDLRGGPLPQGAQSRDQGRRRRPGGLGPLGRCAPKPWKVEGIGEDFMPKTLNGQVVDEWVRVGDAESFRTARELARREGCSSAARRAPPWPRRCGTPGASPPTMSWSSSAPTPAATT